MPPMKIQPIDSQNFPEPIYSQNYREPMRSDLAKPVLKSRLKRLFDRQFPSVLRVSSAPEKPSGDEAQYGKDGGAEFEPSSVCLAKMVQNFMEETNEKPSAMKCGRNRCNCFNGNNNGSSDDEFDVFSGFGDSNTNPESSDTLKSLIPCASAVERNLLADSSKIVDKNKTCKRKDDLRKIVADGLSGLGYDASICKSLWEKSSTYPAGEYEYVDVIVEGERLLIDIDFRSEFEIARSTGNYKAILQSLPYIFVGKADRLQQIVSVVSEAAIQSLKKKGMHIAPWRKAEYTRNKWLSPHTRTKLPPPVPNDAVEETNTEGRNEDFLVAVESDCGEFELIFGEQTTSSETDREQTSSSSSLTSPVENPGEGEKSPPTVSTPWQPPAVKPKTKVLVTGLASLLKEKP
ncbi:unnamed protein product [Ilex paraguariensis]|uniref:Uncharacterized protein n=1 Tax=Ilex paraguariensis TaxID=185542 RepID=A0ABC8QVA7_9AQUA